MIKHIAVMVILLTSLFSVLFLTSMPGVSGCPASQIASAEDYLLSGYNSTAGLIHESPDNINLSRTYWLFSDNFLARLALRSWLTNATVTALVNNDSLTAARYARSLPTLNQYQILSGDASNFGWPKEYVFAATRDGSIKSTVNNQTSFWYSDFYADFAFLHAMSYHQSRNYALSMASYLQGVAMWDGFGFKDAVYRGTYPTYKLALYLIASKTLGLPADPLAPIELLRLQVHTGVDSGGFATEYYGPGIPASGTNTETTSLAAIAMIETFGCVSGR